MSHESYGPSYDDVTRHANKRQLEGFPFVDPKAFWAYYEAVGWKRNGQPIVKWKVLFREWEMRAEREHAELPAHRFRVRDPEHARYCLVWGKKGVKATPDAREWTPDQCLAEYRKQVGA